MAAPVVGTPLLAAMARERRRLRKGRSCEPPTFYETSPSFVESPRLVGATYS
jgi:hypothetical protein